MPIAGIYSPVEDPYETPEEDITYRRAAAFDTDQGGWLPDSDGEIVAEFDTEELKQADMETILDIFYDRYVAGHYKFFIHRESEVPGEIIEGNSSHDPDEFEDVDIVEPEPDAQN